MVREFPGLIIDVVPKPQAKGWVLTCVTAGGMRLNLHTNINLAPYSSPNLCYAIKYVEKPISTSGATYNWLTCRPELLGDLTFNSDTYYSRTDDKAMGVKTLAKHQGFKELVTRWLREHGCGLPITKCFDYLIAERNKLQQDPSRWTKLDTTQVWDRVKALEQDVACFAGGGRWTPTYNEKYDTPMQFSGLPSLESQMLQVTAAYRTKPHHLITKSHRKLTDGTTIDQSQLSDIFDYQVDGCSPNELPHAGIQVHVDAMVAQAALKERHYAEFFLYFAIMGWAKKSHRYPNFKVKDVTQFLRTFIVNPRLKKAGKAILLRLIQSGFLGVNNAPPDGGILLPIKNKAMHVRTKKRATLHHAHQLVDNLVLHCRSQQAYYQTQEAAYVARQYVGRKCTRNMTHAHEEVIDYTANKKKLVFETKSYVDDKRGDPISNPAILLHLHTAIRPYMDIWSQKTTKLDAGFAQLLNSGTQAMKRFLYELVVSSWDTPICRARIAYNTLISRSTQQQYERGNKFLEKRLNFLEIPEDMLNQMSTVARMTVTSHPKFRRSKSGVIYRQEGNSLRSTRIRWVTSKKCARTRLSSRLLKNWQAARPVYPGYLTSGSKFAVGAAVFKPVSNRVVNEQPGPTTYISKKTQMKTPYFALHRNGIACPSTDPDNWETFEPLCQMVRTTGDIVVPHTPSLQRTRASCFAGRGAYKEYVTAGKPAWGTKPADILSRPFLRF